MQLPKKTAKLVMVAVTESFINCLALLKTWIDWCTVKFCIVYTLQSKDYCE